MKDGNLISWNQKLEQAYAEGDFKQVLNLLGQRLTQGGKIVEARDEADLVLGLAKADEENYVSLIDKNFYMDC